MSTYDRRRFLMEALWIAGHAIHEVRQVAPEPLLYVAGSIRRGQDGEETTIGDVDLMIVPEAGDLHDLVLPDWLKVTAKKAHGWLALDGQRMMIDAWLCPAESRGPFAMFLTGPASLNVVMRQISQAAGVMLTQYGVFEPVPKPTRKYPNRMVPGTRLDTPTPDPRTSLGHCEMQFWADWLRLVGLDEPLPAYPQAGERREVTRWLQERSRAIRSNATTPG